MRLVAVLIDGRQSVRARRELSANCSPDGCGNTFDGNEPNKTFRIPLQPWAAIMEMKTNDWLLPSRLPSENKTRKPFASFNDPGIDFSLFHFIHLSPPPRFLCFSFSFGLECRRHCEHIFSYSNSTHQWLCCTHITPWFLVISQHCRIRLHLNIRIMFICSKLYTFLNWTQRLARGSVSPIHKAASPSRVCFIAMHMRATAFGA